MRRVCVFPTALSLALTVASAAPALPAALAPFLETRCGSLVASYGIVDFVVPSAEGRGHLDQELRGRAGELQRPGLTADRRETLHREIAELLFPLLLRTARKRWEAAKTMDREALFDVVEETVRRVLMKVDDGIYRPDSANRFFTYATGFLRWVFLERLRDRERLEHPEPVPPSWLRRLPEAPEPFAGIDVPLVREAFRAALATLEPRERDAVLWGGAGKTLDETARGLLGVSPTRAQQVRVRALQRLRLSLTGYLAMHAEPAAPVDISVLTDKELMHLALLLEEMPGR